MRLGPRTFIYVAAAAALIVGAVAYDQMDGGHDEESLLAGDLIKVAVAVSILAVVAMISLRYLAKEPPGEV